MWRSRVAAMSVAMVLVFVSACAPAGTPSPILSGASPPPGSESPTEPATTPSAAESPASPTTPSATPEPSVPLAPDGQPLYETMPRDAFSDPTTIDNRWLPLTPGTRWAWEGSSLDEGALLQHRVVTTVTGLTKVIDGIPTVVILESDSTDGELVEAELAFFAQDDDGAVWHLGQYPEEYEDGELVAAPAWLAGHQDARAGIAMKAQPEFGPSYSQGWGPAVDWTDRARVFEIGSETCVPVACYDDVLVMSEFTLDEVDAYQLKYYAPGVGNVRVGWAGSQEKEQEVLELQRIVRLTSSQLREAGRAALELEERAYRLSPEVYGHTTPAVPSGG